MMQFYELGIIPSGPNATSFLWMEPHHQGEAPMCPDCGTCLGMLPWLPPYRAQIRAYGGKLGDVVQGGGHSLLVSVRFKQAWEERGLKGLEFTELERLQVRPARLGRPMPVYYHIAPRLFGTRIDFAHSHFKYGGIITCSTCQSMKRFKSVNGYSIDESTWTGEDMFRAWGYPGAVLVSHRVRQMRDDYELKNMEMIPIEDYYRAPYEYPSYDATKAV